MKATTTKGYLNYRTWIRAGMMMMAALTFMTMNTACGSKKSSNNTNTAYVGPQCNGCSGNQVSYTGAVAKQGSSVYGAPIEVDLDFYADQTTLAYSQQTGSPYYGYVTATGTIFIPYAVCGVAAGNYSLSSVSQGVWGADGAGRSIENLTMQASNGMQVYMTGYIQTSSVVGQTGRAYPYRYVANMQMGSCQVALY